MIESFWEQHRTEVSKQYLGSVHSAEQIDDNTFLLADLNSRLYIEAIAEHTLRVRLAPQGTFLPDFSYALVPQEKPDFISEMAITTDCIEIKTNMLTVRVNRENFCASFFDADGKLLNTEDEGPHWEENMEYGGYFIYCNKKMQHHENFYGLGDKAADLNLIRKRFTLWSTDAYAFDWGTDPLYRNIPFYIGLHDGTAYGIFFDNTYKTHFDFGQSHPDEVRYVAEGGELNYYFIAGPSIMEVIQRYHILTGVPPMPPMWGLGYHQCRWSYYPDQKLLDLANEFRTRQIPCDALYLDIDYLEGYRCFTFSKEKFPDPVGMTQKLHEQGFKVVTIIDPGIKTDPDYWVFNEGIAKEYFCRRGDDYLMEGPVWPGRCQFPDFTKPEVRDWWGELHKHLLDAGIDGVWTDMNEPSIFGIGTFPPDVRHHYEGYRGSHRKAHNIYGMQMARATYEGLQKLQRNKRPFVITRSCYSGVQRYASCWTGDNVGTWSHLVLANVQCQRMAMSGISFVGTDIGGFIENADAELFIRWVQLGVFHPLMRAHSSGDTIEREPWSYGPEAEAILKKFIELRYALLPYMYTCFWQNHKYNAPILRPLIMLEQEVAMNIPRQDEFGFGDNILVCPVLHPGISERRLYLPAGDWFYFWNDEFFDGGQEYTVATPLDSMPIFVRAGSVIPQYPPMQFVDHMNIAELILNVYFIDGTHTSLLYEDHGETFAYAQEIYLEKHFEVTGTHSSLKLIQNMEGLFTPRYEYYRLRLHGLPFEPRTIRVDGKNIPTFYELENTRIFELVVRKAFGKLEVAI